MVAKRKNHLLTTVVLLFCTLMHAERLRTDAGVKINLNHSDYSSSSRVKQIMTSEETKTKAATKLQSLSGLHKTGLLNNEMYANRHKKRSRQRRFVTIPGGKWHKSELTYHFKNYTEQLERIETNNEIRRAFRLWSEITPLEFEQINEIADINIMFGYIDGIGHELASSTFLPQFIKICFDDSEPWTINSPRGVNLFQTAVHEIGHTLGLNHSNSMSSVMRLYAKPFDSNFKLSGDDIRGIQSLYGSRPVNRPCKLDEVSTHLLNVREASLCKDLKFDTICNSPTGDTLIFKGYHFWKLNDIGLAAGYPKKIKDKWPELPGFLDAAIMYKKNTFFFFKGNLYWKYIGMNLVRGYPKYISQEFVGVPDDIDTVIHSVQYPISYFYFFKGAMIWKYKSGKKVLPDYPKPISYVFPDIPNDIDAAYHNNNGLTYFFKENTFYRFKKGFNQVFPGKVTAFPWNNIRFLGCKNKDFRTLENVINIFELFDLNNRGLTLAESFW